MKKRMRETKPAAAELDELERKLEFSLYPVQPDPQFVHRLQTRLATPATVVLEDPVRTGAFLIIAAGLFIGALLVWLLQRLRG
jgi:hypothetical protein